MKSYKARNGRVLQKPSYAELTNAHAVGDGFCLACGETQAAEGDAKNHECESCGERYVYGAETLILMGLFHED